MCLKPAHVVSFSGSSADTEPVNVCKLQPLMMNDSFLNWMLA